MKTFAEDSNPVQSFIEEMCCVGEGYFQHCGSLHEEWKKYARQLDYPEYSIQQFGRKMRAALPGLETIQKRRGSERIRAFVGVQTKGVR